VKEVPLAKDLKVSKNKRIKYFLMTKWQEAKEIKMKSMNTNEV
jgi:hypothetical protein